MTTSGIPSSSKVLPKQYRLASVLNEQVRYNHEECGDKKQRLYVMRTRNGWVFHCHNCAPHMSGFMRDFNVMTPAQTLRAINEPIPIRPEKKSGIASLPDDFTPDLPTSATLWLYKYGILEAERAFYGFGYSPRHHRLVMPIHSRNGLIGWQGRALDDQKPKYMTFVGDGKLWFDTRHGEKTHREYDRKDTICLVEDIVSAVKVGRIARAIALLGSYVREDLVTWMKQVQKLRPELHWCLWLDPDKHVEMHKIAARLRALGLNVSTISTSCDPKDCDMITIRNLLEI
jgi:hypothetical protein